MNGTHNIAMGDRGRVVIPAEVRERLSLDEGVRLVSLETPGGLVLMRREQLLARVRGELAGLDLVEELLTERPNAANVEDAA